MADFVSSFASSTAKVGSDIKAACRSLFTGKAGERLDHGSQYGGTCSP